MGNKTKCGLRMLILSKNVLETREREREKLGQGEKIKIVGVILFTFLASK